MFKKIVCILLILCTFTMPAYAHLTGAFAEFLAVVYDQNTMSKLRQQMEETKEEIEQLTPIILQAEKKFTDNQVIAIDQLQFFSEVGLDTTLALIEQGNDIVDILGSKWIIEYKIEQYLDELNALYLQYKQLRDQQEIMQGHTELLTAIEKNIAARDAYLQAAEGLDLETLANYLDIDWTSEVEYNLIEDLKKDQQLIDTQLTNWLQSTASGNTMLESWLNERSNARYYFRNDHIYIEYKVNAEHVLLLGQVLQNEKTAQLILEAGFYNGFFLPDELLNELQGFSISTDTILDYTQIENPYIVQQNGSLQIQGK